MNVRDHIEEIRQDFPILKREMNGWPLAYLDNSATTLKPQAMIDEVVRYYTYLGANAHRGDYEMSAQVDHAYEGARKTVAGFIHAQKEEIVFTSGTTEGLNLLAMMITNQILNDGDVILSTETEHASSILPWQQAGYDKKIQVDFIPLTKEGRLTAENFEKAIAEHPNTKVVCFAQVSNVLGYTAPVKEICEIAHKHNIIVVVDGAQSVAHMPVDVKDLDVDFFCFSGHKICGPTGIGVLYGKKEWLETLKPVIFGGESNARYYKYEELVLKRSPFKYESGTQPIEGALGLAAALRYISKIGLDSIHAYELELKNYFLKQYDEKLKDKVKLYNRDNGCGIITFNVFDNEKLIFPQDMATYLSSQGIAVRSGQHCAKLMHDYIQAPGTVRASLYFYNTFEDIDRLVKALQKASFENCLDIFF